MKDDDIIQSQEDNKEQQAERKYLIMIELLKREVSNLEGYNRE